MPERVEQLNSFVTRFPSHALLDIHFEIRPVRDGGEWKLNEDTTTYYRLFYPGFTERLDFPREAGQRLTRLASELRESLMQSIGEFIKTGSTKGLEDFRVDSNEFSEQLNSVLKNKEVKKRFERAVLRRELRELGLVKFLLKNTDKFGLNQHQAFQVLRELRPKARSIASMVNQFCIDKLKDLSWDYLDAVEHGLIEDLPALPINLLVARIKFEDASQKRSVAAIKEFEIDLKADDWMFEGPSFKLREDGKVILFKRVNFYQKQTSPLLLFPAYSGIDLSSAQDETLKGSIDRYK